MSTQAATTTTTTTPAVAGTPGSSHTALEAIAELLLALDDRRADLAAAGDHQALLQGLVAMRALRQQLQVLERATEADAASLLDLLPREGRARRWVLDDVGLVELQNQYPARAYDPSVLPALVRAALDPDSTGELPSSMPVLEVADRVATAIADCARLEWRTGDPQRGNPGLRTYGIDPNAYRAEAGEPRTVVRITAATGAQ